MTTSTTTTIEHRIGGKPEATPEDAVHVLGYLDGDLIVTVTDSGDDHDIASALLDLEGARDLWTQLGAHLQALANHNHTT